MRFKKPDRIVPEMWIGELAFGLICELAGVWFVQDKLGYTIGLFLGVLLAMAAAYHIWWVLDTAMDLDEKSAGKMMGSRYLYRYLALIALILILYYTNFGNAFTAFLGYMSLKVTAYIQPITHKIWTGITGTEDYESNEIINQERGE